MKVITNQDIRSIVDNRFNAQVVLGTYIRLTAEEKLTNLTRAGHVHCITDIDPTHFATITFNNKVCCRDLEAAKKEIDRVINRFHNGIFGSRYNRVIPIRVVDEHHKDGTIHFHLAIHWDREEERLIHHWEKTMRKMATVTSGVRGNHKNGHQLVEIGSRKILAGQTTRLCAENLLDIDDLTADQVHQHDQVNVGCYMVKEDGYVNDFVVYFADKRGVI